ncbi:unnamed protein product [Effrenium voratum]|uniref:Uncharacterized protein n=1 Tax=Effrenium voratum TaxID=2562239 RepID=A0AA36HTR6_9DINO|nr:unnamed protein product [Effrenium voratum]
MAGRPPPRKRRRDWGEEDVPHADSREPSPNRDGGQLRRPFSRLLERRSRSRSPQRRVIIPGRRSRSPSRRGRRPPGRMGPDRGGPDRGGPDRGALPRRRVGDDGGWGRHRSGSGLTLTPAAGARRDDEEFARRRFGGRRGDQDDEDDWHRQDPERSKKNKLRLEDWILAVNLLLSWDDQKTISAAEMEGFLSRFLEYDAKVKYRITPRLTSEIFLRGILRTLWDIDRLLRVMNPGEELKMVTAKSPLVLSILRVMAYEFMWTPNCTPRGAREGARDLMERVSLSVKADREWITDAMIRMGEAFEKAHNDWDKKHQAAKEKKRRERAQQAAAAAGGGDLTAGGAKVKLADNAKAAKAARAQGRKKEGGDPVKRRGADAHFGNARALAAKAGKDQADAKLARTVVVRPAAAQDEGDEDEEGEEAPEREDAEADAEADADADADAAVEDAEDAAGEEGDGDGDGDGEGEGEGEETKEDGEGEDGEGEEPAGGNEPQEDGQKTATDGRATPEAEEC